MKVLITGHTSGIGASLLDTFVNNGFLVYGISRSISKKINISNQIQVDLSLEDDIEKIQPWVSNLKPDIFFHCAGSNPITPLSEATSKIYKDCFNLHFLSASQIIRTCLKVKKKDKPLKVLLLSSIWSLISAHSRGPYSVSKNALNSLAKQIAVEHGKSNVQAISIALGFVDTKLTKLTSGDINISSAKERYLFKSDKMPNADKVATFLFNLSSQDFSMMNGNTINLDGGIICQ